MAPLTDDASVTGAGTAIGSGVTDGLAVINENMPTVFGVAIAWVAWKVGRKVLGHI